MSAILSADDLNDFISPGVACIKPVETLPKQVPKEDQSYGVVKEGQLPQDHKGAQISLTDCLACSGCVTSAEAVLVSLQSHAEVLNSLDESCDKVFVASVSPQVRASIAATYDVSEREAGWMIDQLLAGPEGLGSGGKHRNSFRWIIDTNAMREASLVLGSKEVTASLSGSDPSIIFNGNQNSDKMPKRPILSSACPGWICYAEKTHPHVLSHLSSLKSPQALTGTLLKTVLSQRLNIRADQIWHVAVMPCFDKKLEASREELTDVYWRPDPEGTIQPPVRDVDCVITARELLMLAETRDISFPKLPQQPLAAQSTFPDPTLSAFLFPTSGYPPHRSQYKSSEETGTSGGYLHHILSTQLSLHPASTLTSTRGRNNDVIEYIITHPSLPPDSPPIFKAARYYGFRNIQNLVRKLKPPKKSRLPGARPKITPSGNSNVTDYAYVEVMACPGGCTNGGGQIKVDDLPAQAAQKQIGQKEWLQKVDEAYYSISDDSDRNDEGDVSMDGKPHENGLVMSDEINGISPSYIKQVLDHWASSTGIPLEKLVRTTYRKVESDVGKSTGADSERVVESIAGKIGGGW